MTTRRGEQAVAYAIVLAFVALTLVPLLNVLFTALHPPGALVAGFGVPDGVSFDSFANAWTEGRFATYLRTSALIAVAVVALTSVVSVGAGYALGTMDVPGGRVVLGFFLVGLVVPFEAMLVPLYYDLQRFDLTNTPWAVILPQAALSTAFGAFWMRAFFRALPRGLVEAARIDGAGPFAILWRVLLPLGWPALTTLMVLSFMWSWNDFLLPLVMLSGGEVGTAPIGLALFKGQHVTDTDYPSTAAASILVALPVVAVYLFLQRHFIRGVLAGALKT